MGKAYSVYSASTNSHLVLEWEYWKEHGGYLIRSTVIIPYTGGREASFLWWAHDRDRAPQTEGLSFTTDWERTTNDEPSGLPAY
jgi:hypothetical protein